MTVSRNSPSRNVRPSTSRPRSTKNAVVVSRSVTVIPTWSSCLMYDMTSILQCLSDLWSEDGAAKAFSTCPHHWLGVRTYETSHPALANHCRGGMRTSAAGMGARTTGQRPPRSRGRLQIRPAEPVVEHVAEQEREGERDHHARRAGGKHPDQQRSSEGSAGVPAALAPTGVSVSHPKARLDGHAWNVYPHPQQQKHLMAEDLDFGSTQTPSSTAQPPIMQAVLLGCPPILTDGFGQLQRSSTPRVRATMRVAHLGWVSEPDDRLCTQRRGSAAHRTQMPLAHEPQLGRLVVLGRHEANPRLVALS